jgi:hypothetical protein
MLPPKRKRQRSGIERAERRVFMTHRAFVKRHSCCVPGCEEGPIEFAHVKSRGAGGGDWFGVSLCPRHHREQHSVGIDTFQAKHKIDLWAIAEQFVRATTDKALKEHLKGDTHG